MDKTEGIKIEEEIKNLNNQVNEFIQKISYLWKIRFYLLIYRLLKRGHVGATEIAECAEIDRTSVYNILDKVEKFLQENHES